MMYENEKRLQESRARLTAPCPQCEAMDRKQHPDPNKDSHRAFS